MTPAAGGRRNDTQPAPTIWLGWLGSNQRMRESKSRALPLGYTPMLRFSVERAGADAPALRHEYGVDNGARTHDTRNHNPVLCQLSYIHHIKFFSAG